MLHLTHAIDRATGYVYVPPPGAKQPEGAIADPHAAGSERPNKYALMSSAAGPLAGARSDVRDVQERWVDARDQWDAYESEEWRREGETVRRAADSGRAKAEVEKKANTSKIRERKAM
jgi:hypothetical protein